MTTTTKKHECIPFTGKLPHGLAKYRNRITDVSNEDDGIFVYFVPGWKREPNDPVHFVVMSRDDGDTLKDLERMVKGAVKCSCDECRQLIQEFKNEV